MFYICCSVAYAVMGPFAFPLSRKWQGSSSWLPSATQSWPMWMRVSAAALATTRHILLPQSGELNLSCLPLASFISAFILASSSTCTHLHLCLLLHFAFPLLPLPLTQLNSLLTPLWPTDNCLQYNAQSPDEAALVGAAKNFGYIFAVSHTCSALFASR